MKNEFLDEFNGKVMRLWKYKRMFTPLEQEKKYIDQSEYVDDLCQFVFVTGMYDVSGKTIVSYCPVYSTEFDDDGNLHYDGIEFENVDNIHLAYFESDTEDFKNGEI